MDLNLVHTVFEVSSGASYSLLPQLYNAVGNFGSFFKSLCCTQNGIACHLCIDQSGPCPYRSVFGQALSTDPDVVRRHQKPPLPFAFNIKQTINKNPVIELNLVIAGDAIQHISVFRDAISMMLSDVAVNCGVNLLLTGAWCLDYQRKRHILDRDLNGLVFLSCLEILQATQHSESIQIHIDTPLRLLSGGSIVHTFDFGILLRSQLRRCSSFFAYYGQGELEMDFVFLSKAADKVITLESCFSFIKPDRAQRAGMEGLSGSGEFTDLAEGMLPILTLGCLLNAGKGAAYGMGAYQVAGASYLLI